MNKMIEAKDNQIETKHIVISKSSDYQYVRDSHQNTVVTVKDGVEAVLTLLEENQDTVHTYELGKNSKLKVYHIVFDGSTNITADLDESSEIEYHVSVVTRKKGVVKEKINHHASYTKSNFYNHAVSLHDEFSFFVDGIIPKSSRGCICNQDNKIVCLEDGKGEIRPNLYIDNYDVVANHSAFIGKFSGYDLFYLASRGLSLESSYRLLTKGFLFGKMKLQEDLYQEVLEKIK